MRVTQSMLTENMLKNINQSYSRMGRLQDQLATQKKISRPSDDPVVAIKGITYRSNLNEIDQYKRNLNEAYTWMDTSENALEELTNVYHRMRELVIQSNGASLTQSDQKLISAEIGQLKDHIDSISATKVAGKFIFNGNSTSSEPTPPWNNLDSSDVKLELSKGIEFPVNVKGSKIFNEELNTDIENIITELAKPEPDLEQFSKKLDAHLNNVITERAELGARYNRMELIESRLGGQEVNATNMISKNEDVDVEKVITSLKIEESIQRAALSVGARIIQPSLLDFLR